MASLSSLSIKQKDGSYKNYTIQINDETNDFGQNVVMYEEQTKEQREAKEKRKYIANGKVFWTDGTIKVAEKKEKTQNNSQVINNDDSDLPF